MTRVPKVILYFCLATSLIGCRHISHVSVTKTEAQAFVGKTVAEFLDAQKITLSNSQFHDEPPGVLRELSFPTANGRLRIALKREPSLFSAQRQWSPEVVQRAHIAEVRYADH